MTESQPHGASVPQNGYAPQYQQYQPEPPKKKRGRGCLWMILGALLLVVLIIVGTMALIGGAAKKVDDDMHAKHSVTFKVTGGSKADITYTSDTNASVAQENAAKLPWSKTLNVEGMTSGMNISAQNGMDGASGKITCEVIVDGKSVKTNTSSGQGAIASCAAP